MIWIKSWDTAYDWNVYVKSLGINDYLFLNSTTAKVSNQTAYYQSTPTDTSFTLGTSGDTNGNGKHFAAFLFASVPGISKIGSFSHTYGNTTNVDCGFTSGARFVLWKRTDGTRHWEVFDTTRGIVAGYDNYLRLSQNTLTASATSDLIDPYSAGFSIGSDLGTGDFIFYAIA
jgi:hypothetical protein